MLKQNKCIYDIMHCGIIFMTTKHILTQLSLPSSMQKIKQNYKIVFKHSMFCLLFMLKYYNFI